MSSTLNNIVIFTAGAAIGSVVTWKLLRDRYEQLANEEIESMREYFELKNPKDETEEDHSDDPAVAEPVDIRGYAEELSKNGYTNYSDNEKPEEKEVADVEKPYVITPDEFGELRDYETISLTYYADGILTDTHDEIVEDVDDIVGLDSLNHFGEYEDDSVFVRNDARRSDYEILLDSRNYSDVVNTDPHSAEVE